MVSKFHFSKEPIKDINILKYNVFPWTFKYKLNYVYELFHYLINKQSKLDLDTANYYVVKDFLLTKNLKCSWYDTFKCNEKLNYQFTYYYYLQSMVFFRVLSELGVDFSKIMVVGIKLHFSPYYKMQQNQNYQLIMRPKAVFKIRENCCLLETKTYVLNDKNKVCQINQVDLVIGNCKLNGFDPSIKQKYFDLRKRQSMIDADNKVSVFQATDSDIKEYAKISGDYNPIHTNKLIANLFGLKTTIIQGLITTNYISKILTETISDNLRLLDLTLVSPIYAGEAVDILVLGNNIEVVDDKKKLKVLGEFRYK